MNVFCSDCLDLKFCNVFWVCRFNIETVPIWKFKSTSDIRLCYCYGNSFHCLRLGSWVFTLIFDLNIFAFWFQLRQDSVVHSLNTELISFYEINSLKIRYFKNLILLFQHQSMKSAKKILTLLIYSFLKPVYFIAVQKSVGFIFNF